MLPAFIKTETWKELAEMLANKLKTAIVCEQAVYGKLSFFQELRNRMSDAPHSNKPGIKYVTIEHENSKIHIGPFKTNEAHTLDEELADAREKLPEWKEHYQELIETNIKQAIIASKHTQIKTEGLNRAKLLLEFLQATGHSKDTNQALYTSLQFLSHKFKLSNIFISAYGKHARLFDINETAKAVEQRITAQIKATKTICTIQNVQKDFLLEGIKDRDKIPKCATGYPMTMDRELIGYAITYSEQSQQIDDTSEVIYELTRILMRLAQQEKVQESAITDPLTGLNNRAELVKKFDELIKKQSESKQPISVMMMDIDNFKKYNDTQGHPEGDRVLKAVSEIIKTLTPKNSISSRYGGEEFMIILPEKQQEAKEFAEKIRSEIEKNSPLTISIGLMTCMNSSASRETLIREADRALYRAKELGKNKVISFMMLDKTLGIIDT
ncbi:GGDEF domain-containing protein [Candidatus Woesearchaeota archaeon]|nr:GGDEF domain-containing protein [Candidatus Woesearchaeota archaeon]